MPNSEFLIKRRTTRSPVSNPQSPFSKYHALGNDYLIFDPNRQPPAMARGLTAEQAIAICDRQRGVGSDGIVYGPLVEEEKEEEKGDEQPGHFACVIWNPDGSQAEVSGNGLRIFARYLVDAGYVDLAEAQECVLHSGGRAIPIRYGDQTDAPIRVELGRAITGPGPESLPADLLATLGTPTSVDVGNPHCVFFPSAPIDEELTRRWGPVVENDPAFPNRTNVQFVRVIDRHVIAIEIWERGAGYTQASGSSSCGAALAAISRGHCVSPVAVQMPGGELIVDVTTNADGWRVALTGPVTAIFEGSWRLG